MKYAEFSIIRNDAPDTMFVCGVCRSSKQAIEMNSAYLCKQCANKKYLREKGSYSEEYLKNQREKRKIRRQENIEVEREKARRLAAKARKKNPEKVKERYAKWRKAHLTEARAKAREYAAKSYAENRDRILERNREQARVRWATDTNYRLKKLLRTRLRSALKKGFKTGSAVRDLGCSIEEAKNYIESMFYNGMAWSNCGNRKGQWQIHHIRPLYSFNLEDNEQLKEACHYTNLKPLWYDDHLKVHLELGEIG